jgi:hypothetical protein
MTYVDQRQAKLVRVLVDGQWYDGTLEAWRKVDAGGAATCADPSVSACGISAGSIRTSYALSRSS